MRKITSISLSIIFLFGLLSSTQDDRIDQIRAWYKEIEEKLDQCKLVVTDGDYFEGAIPEIKGWFDSVTNQFVKIEVYKGADHHEETASYYLNNGTVFFTFTKGYGIEEYYTAAEMEMSEEEYYESGMEAKSYDAWEERLYFDSGQCIRALSKSKVFLADEEQSFTSVDNKSIEIDTDAYQVATEQVNYFLEFLKLKQAE